MTSKYSVLEGNTDLLALKKNYRKADLYDEIHNNTDLLNFLQVALIDFIDNKYPAQRDINNEYQKTLISECKYFGTEEKPQKKKK